MFNATSCQMCKDSISDPVCIGCYIRQTRILLNDLKIHSIIKDFISRQLKEKLYSENLDYTECILCKKDNVTLCRYCFSRVLRGILIELNFPEDLMENFNYSSYPEDVSLENEILVR